MSAGYNTSFGQWLKERRKALDVTQEELADHLGYSRVAIQKIEMGERRPSRQIADLLADYFSVPADERAAFAHFARFAPSASSPTASQAAPWREGRRQHTNLPTPPTPLIGREHELEELRKQLSSQLRLVTLTGPPGIGKTRLALEVAADEDLAGHFDDGVFFVELAPIRDPDLVAPTIATALEVKETGGKSPLEALKARLASKRLLLVLDNFEQVLDTAPQVAELLAASPWLKVLVTSREALHLRGERTFRVPPLAVPSTPILAGTHHSALITYSAVNLFVERAQDADPDFELTVDNAGAVAAICARLDGLPLAIELAAARTTLYSPQALLELLSDRLALLSGGLRDLPPRQQTLRNAIGWSYGLLDEGEKVLFRRLGVFVGGSDLSAAEAICNAQNDLPLSVRDGVASLLNKNLLQMRRSIVVDGEGRYTMLETIREFALGRLGASPEAESTRRLHAEHYLALAEAASLQFNLADQKAWFDRIEAELDNLRAALHWTLRNAEAELALRLAGALSTFWIRGGYLTEGREQLRRILSATEGTDHVAWRANALYGAGRLALLQNDYPVGRSLCEQSLSLYERSGDRQGMANSLHQLALAARRQGDLATARSLGEESLSMRRELNDTHGLANSLFNLALVLVEQADYRTARSLLKESADLFQGVGNRRGRAHVLVGLGEVARCLSEYANAYATYSEALAIFRELGDKMGSASALLNLGYVAYHEGDSEQAAALFTESLVLKRELDETNGIALCLVGLAGASGAVSQAAQFSDGARQAAMLLGAADGLLGSVGARLPYADRIEYDRIVAAVRSQLDEAAFQTAREEGRAMSLEQAVTYALGDQAELSSSDSA